MTRRQRIEALARELASMARVKPGTEQATFLMGRKKRVVRELHALWPSTSGVDKVLVARIVCAVQASGRTGMTGDELERRLRVLHQSLAGPLLAARASGAIRDSGRTRQTRWKREAVVWIGGAA